MNGPEKKSPLRVLVVDDSPVCRLMLTDILQRAGDILVVGCAVNGEEAVELNLRLRPDLITMDINMPGMDGFAATEKIMAQRPVPILVVTDSPVHQGVDRSFQALAAGALDLIPKPSLEGKEADALVERVRLLAGVKVIARRRRIETPPLAPAPAREKERRIVAIGASTGGPRALREILCTMRADHRCVFLVTQHIPDGFCEGFARWLAGEISLKVSLARDGDWLQPGRVFIAPSGRHLGLGNKNSLRLSNDPPCDNHRPSASYMFRSLAHCCPSSSVGILLTGMGRDGAAGMLELRRAGGWCIAQNRQSSVVFGMPQQAIELGAADLVLDTNGIRHFLEQLDSEAGHERR